ncbi:MAG: Trk system potassium transporter TrkA [Firmicutes bacterium]|nr:Trk system potassium transporter TrkA [Bacillota bacterium]
MKIVIVGCGNVGRTLTEQLSREGYDITIIDEQEQLVKTVSNSCDVMGVVGNGASLEIQQEAGVDKADMLIAVTRSDERNLLCCLIAKKAGAKHTIARVSNPVYSREVEFIREELGLSMVINPQRAAAREIERLLKFPSALKIDEFSKSRVDLINYSVNEGSPLCNMKLKDMPSQIGRGVLIPVVERDDDVIIPGGDFEIKPKDVISIIGSSAKTVEFFRKLKEPTSIVKDVMIVGGSKTCYYLAQNLIEMGVSVKIIERDKDTCDKLSEMLPQALIIHGDATDRELLMEEGISQVQAFISLTNIDEENVMLTLFAKSVSKAKLITKVHRVTYDKIIDNLEIGSVVYPKNISAEIIIKYVRAMDNSDENNIESLYRLNENRVEAIEFTVPKGSPVAGKQLLELSIKPNIIIACITHNGNVVIPNGQSVIQEGDSVILVTTNKGLSDIKDILR